MLTRDSLSAVAGQAVLQPAVAADQAEDYCDIHQDLEDLLDEHGAGYDSGSTVGEWIDLATDLDDHTSKRMMVFILTHEYAREQFDPAVQDEMFNVAATDPILATVLLVHFPAGLPEDVRQTIEDHIDKGLHNSVGDGLGHLAREY